MQICPNQMLPKHCSGIIQVVIPNQLWMGQKSAIHRCCLNIITCNPSGKEIIYIYILPIKNTIKKKTNQIQTISETTRIAVTVPLLSIQNIIIKTSSHRSHLLTSGSKAPHGRTRGAKHASDSGSHPVVISVEKGTVSPRKMKR